MSVAAAMTLEERPLINSYDKMSKQYEQNMHVGGIGSGGVGGSGGSGSGNVGGGVAAPPSGPASPTPSGPEDPLPPTTQQQHTYHHVHHQHPHHHHQQQHQQFHHHRHQSTSLEQHQQQLLLSNNNAAGQSAGVSGSVTDAEAEQRQRLLEEEIESLKLEQARLAQQCADAQRREKILTRRLANKEQEFQDYVSQIAEYKAAQAPSALALRTALLDPAVNLLFEKLKKELKATKAKLEETQNELSAWKFTPDSNTGKRLMAKCRLLYQENEELGKMTSNGRLAKLETELAMQKSFKEEVKKSQSELDDFLQELDEDVEGMQSTILFLQQELKLTQNHIQVLEKENFQLKNGGCLSNVIKDVVDVATPLPLNGNGSNDANAMTLSYKTVNNNNNTNNNQQQASLTVTVNEKKYQGSMLESIEEETCLRITRNSDYFNGAGNVGQDATPAPTPTPLNVTTVNTIITAATTAITIQNATNSGSGGGGGGIDDGSNGSSNNSANGKFRTAASRKRNYDSDSNELMNNANAASIITTAAVPQQVSTPRTLPPKKSKLRVTPARRASAQSNEQGENELALASSGCGIGVVASAIDPLAIVDNAVAGMANEETSNVAGAISTLDETGSAGGGVEETDGGVAQRIMTRRRSVRTQQQNGSSGGIEINY